MIEGVIFKTLISHNDVRGFFREVGRQASETEFWGPVNQVSHTFMKAGVLKAWHYHLKQTDYWYVVKGKALIGLCDIRKNSKTFEKKMRFYVDGHLSGSVVKIPPGVAHGIRADCDVDMVYFTSRVYDPNDELRLPPDHKKIGFNWNVKPVGDWHV